MSPATLKRLTQREAWSAEALAEAGVPATTARTWLVADSAPAERARLSLSGRKRTAPTTNYAWGPDIAFLASERGMARGDVFMGLSVACIAGLLVGLLVGIVIGAGQPVICGEPSYHDDGPYSMRLDCAGGRTVYIAQ